MVDKYEKYKHNIVLCFDLASTQFTEELQEDINDCCAEILKCIDELKEYKKIGTVEECKMAMGKVYAKKRTILHGNYYCCECGRLAEESGHCRFCGQSLY